jgi:hypothetical protein
MIIHRVDHAVIASAHAQVRSVAGQGKEPGERGSAAKPSMIWATAFRTGGSSCRSDRRACGRTSIAQASASGTSTGQALP